jgi:hypothetical protein
LTIVTKSGVSVTAEHTPVSKWAEGANRLDATGACSIAYGGSASNGPMTATWIPAKTGAHAVWPPARPAFRQPDVRAPGHMRVVILDRPSGSVTDIMTTSCAAPARSRGYACSVECSPAAGYPAAGEHIDRAGVTSASRGARARSGHDVRDAAGWRVEDDDAHVTGSANVRLSERRPRRRPGQRAAPVFRRDPCRGHRPFEAEPPYAIEQAPVASSRFAPSAHFETGVCSAVTLTPDLVTMVNRDSPGRRCLAHRLWLSKAAAAAARPSGAHTARGRADGLASRRLSTGR